MRLASAVDLPVQPIPPLPAELLTTAGRQGMHLRRAQLTAHLPERVVRHLQDAGIVFRVRPDVYRLVGCPQGREADRDAVLLAIESVGGYLSHGTAAQLLGLSRVRQVAAIEATVPYGVEVRRPGVLLHRTRTFHMDDVIEVHGRRVSRASRTLADLAPRHTPGHRIALLDDMIGAGLVPREVLLRRLEALRPGRSALEPLLVALRAGAEQTFRSFLERTGARVFRSGGLSGARWNVSVARDGRVIAILDVVFGEGDGGDDRGLPVELDGPAFHDRPAGQARDRHRYNLLRQHGIVPLRFGYSDVMDQPDRVVCEIGRALRNMGLGRLVDERRWPGSSNPPA